MTHTIQLDIAADCPYKVIIRDTLKFDIAAKLVTPFGPGGGNPVYEFFGTFENILQFCKTYDFPEEYIEPVKA